MSQCSKLRFDEGRASQLRQRMGGIRGLGVLKQKVDEDKAKVLVKYSYTDTYT